MHVTDGNGGNVYTSLTVTVTDANDAPEFIGKPYSTTIDEKLDSGATVLKVSAVDQDSGATLNYSLSGTNNGHFSVSTNGLITTVQALNYEDVTSYSLTVSVTDGSATSTASVTLAVNNKNDEPVFTSAPYETTVDEDNAGAAVYTVSATDEDTSDTLSFFLAGSGSADFVLDSSTGAVTLARALDYEASSFYYLQVVVLDGNGGSATTNLNVTVNDVNDGPMFLSTPYSASIQENLNSGTKVLKTTATDQDSGDTLSFSLSGTNSSHFSVSSTGLVTTTQTLDKETVDSYSINVTVSDGSASVTEVVTITVIDTNDAPTFSNAPYTANVGEGDAAAAVYTASAVDEDSGDSLSFSLSGTGSTDFTIDSATGVITLTSSLDYETKQSYTLNLRVSDGNGGVGTTTLTVTVIDANDVPVLLSAPYSVSVAENQPIGTTVLNVGATDQDPSDTLTFSLSGSNNAHFSIGSSTGVITTAQALNRESVNSYSLTVSVSDGTTSANESLTIAVNNANDAPTFSNAPYNASVNENGSSGSIYTVSATDGDGDSIAYSIYGTGSEHFSVHSSSGLVSLVDALDFESNTAYTLTVQASDSNGGVATTSLHITVVNQNDSPTFTGTPYSTSVDEGISVGSIVFLVQAADEDSADTLAYSLSGNNSADFQIGSASGIITVGQVWCTGVMFVYLFSFRFRLCFCLSFYLCPCPCTCSCLYPCPCACSCLCPCPYACSCLCPCP